MLKKWNIQLYNGHISQGWFRSYVKTSLETVKILKWFQVFDLWWVKWYYWHVEDVSSHATHVKNM